MTAELVGISLGTAPGRAAYIPLAHRGGGDAGELFGGGDLAPANCRRAPCSIA